jgi:hypothetical protein
MMKMQERYQNDPVFHSIVDLLCMELERGQYTPTEVREAAMLAQIMYEERQPRPVIFTRGDVMSGKV